MSASTMAAAPSSLLKLGHVSLTCACAHGRVLLLLPDQKNFIRPPNARPSMREALYRCSSAKKSRRDKRRKEIVKLPFDGGLSGKSSRLTDDTSSQEIETAPDSLSWANESPARDTIRISSRSTVLQALRRFSCRLRGSLPVVDCTSQVSWLVVLISSSRYLLLKAWPDFSESSEASNQQEIQFRGALLQIFGMNWASIVFMAALFGVLQLDNGRNYSFAIWATFFALAYGYATMISSSIWVTVLSHSLNNLAGGVLWRLKSEPSSK